MRTSIRFKRLIAALLFAALIIPSVFSMTGCTTVDAGDNFYDNVVFISVNQANQTNADYSSQYVSDIIYNTAYNYGSIAQISCDGAPRIVIDAVFNEPDIRIDKQRRKIEAGNNRDVILEALPVANAKEPECDLLKALSMAADRIHSLKGSGIIIIHNSGISTTGDLDFASADLIHTDPGYIVQELTERHSLPDLSGIHLVWYGMGSTASPQTELSSEYKYNLQTIWEAILDETGVDYYIDPAPCSLRKEAASLPEVSGMPVIYKNSIGEDGDLPDYISFDEDAVRFNKGTAVFKDETVAAESLVQISDYLLADSNRHIQVIGSTASAENEDFCLKLSRERAQACANLLISKGVKESQLTVTGIGRNPHPLRTKDLDADGNLIESAAKFNRSVFFVRKDS